MPRDLVASARAEIEGSRFLETLWNRIPEDDRESFTEAQRAVLADAEINNLRANVLSEFIKN